MGNRRLLHQGFELVDREGLAEQLLNAAVQVEFFGHCVTSRKKSKKEVSERQVWFTRTFSRVLTQERVANRQGEALLDVVGEGVDAVFDGLDELLVLLLGDRIANGIAEREEPLAALCRS